MGNRESGELSTNHIRYLLACLCLWLLSATSAWAQTPNDSQFPIPDSPPLEISLLTIGPGPIFWERFGHNAIVVRDRAAGTAIAYNYGIFDFDQDDFLVNFARGHMRYRIAADDLEDDIDMYREESRSITEQHLAFTPEQAAVLRDFLVWNTRPENAYYHYEYFLANCSTRVRDALDQALGGAIKRDTEGRSHGYTYRMDALRLMAAEPLLMLGIDLGLGPSADERIDFWRESFVPAVLARALHEVRAIDAEDRQPLVTAERLIATGTVAEPPELPPDLRLGFLLLGLALGLLIFRLRSSKAFAARLPLAIFAGVFELFCGIGGLLLLVLWFWTDHQSAWRNENLLLLNPLCLALIPAAVSLARAQPRISRWTMRLAWLIAALAAFALFSKILPWFAQANLHWILLFLPIHIALAIGMGRTVDTR